MSNQDSFIRIFRVLNTVQSFIFKVHVVAASAATCYILSQPFSSVNNFFHFFSKFLNSMFFRNFPYSLTPNRLSIPYRKIANSSPLNWAVTCLGAPRFFRTPPTEQFPRIINTSKNLLSLLVKDTIILLAFNLGIKTLSLVCYFLFLNANPVCFFH